MRRADATVKCGIDNIAPVRRLGVPRDPAGTSGSVAAMARLTPLTEPTPGARRSFQANRGRDTKPERRLRSAVHGLGLRYRVDQAPIPGVRRRADLVFRHARVAVFLDGCFWHGCPEHYSFPKANAEFWAEKRRRNMERDRETDALCGKPTGSSGGCGSSTSHQGDRHPNLSYEESCRRLSRRRALASRDFRLCAARQSSQRQPTS